MKWKTIVQLTMVHVAVSITVVPVTSTLNRIMIADLGFSAFLVGILVSLPYLLSPLQVMVGHWADRNPLWGYHRSPWIVIGGMMASFGGYFTAHTVYLMADNFVLGLLAALTAFMTWGLGVNIASVSYLALLSELSEPQKTADTPSWRTRSVSIMWTAMILTTIVTSLSLSTMLEPFSETALYTALGAIWLAATILILFGAAGIEQKSSQQTTNNTPSRKNPTANQNNYWQAYQVIRNNPSARRFFLYLVLVLVSIHAQDVLLEPFGAEALGMSVSQTSRLTSIWGLGVFITLLGGIGLIRVWGKKKSANIGAIIAAIAFALIIIAGLQGLATFFMGAIFLLGLGGGLMTISNLSFMLDMTLPQASGLYIGAWGVANFAGQALGNIVSGLLRDIVYRITADPVLGYITVFGLEIVGLLVAVIAFRTISVTTFQADAQRDAFLFQSEETNHDLTTVIETI
ncbi:MAG: BCD family MFS transporter [Chloroflexota bacterium]